MFAPRFASLIVFLFPFDALSAGLECEPPAAVFARIRYCADNTHAAAATATCAALLEKAWHEASRDLSAVEEAGAGQRGGFGVAQERYDAAADRLRALILDTQRNTARIAAYPGVMVDDPALQDFSGSLPCFRTVYDDIQRTVTRLDKRVVRGKKLLELAIRMRATSAKLARGSASVSPIAAATKARGEAPAAAQRQPARISDITGTREETN